jgi:hypothetical protein
LEYFVAGDVAGGITKILSNFTWTFGLGQLFSIFSGLYLVFRLFFQPESILIEDGIHRTFPWQFVMESNYCGAGTINPADGCKSTQGESTGWFSFMLGWLTQMKWYKYYLGGPIGDIATVASVAKTVVNESKKTVIPAATQASAGSLALAAQAPAIEAKATASAHGKYTNANSIKELYNKQQGQQGGNREPEPQAGATLIQNIALITALGVTVATGVYLAKLPSLSEVDVSFILPFYKRKSASGPDDTPP